MHFKTEMMDTEVPKVLHDFVRIAGLRIWEKRLAWLEEQVGQETGMRRFWIERCGLELGLLTVARQYADTGGIAGGELSAEEQRFLSFAAMMVRCHERLSNPARKRLKGMLRDAARQDTGLGSIAYEMKIAAHLMSKGFEVEFRDLEGKTGCDFLVTKDDARAEIECKFMSGDIGRKIHRKRLYQLGDRVSKTMQDYVNKLRTGVFIRLVIPDRLHGKEEYQTMLAELLSRAIFGGRQLEDSHGNRVTVQEFDIEVVTGEWETTSGFDREGFRETLLRHFGVLNKCSLAYFRPKQSAIVVVVESKRNDKVLDAMQRQLLKAAKSQFSGDLPAMLCCHLVDVTEEQLLSLGNHGGEGTGLDQMTEDLIMRRPHLYSVSYSAPGRVHSDLKGNGGESEESYREKGPARTRFNGKHPLFGDRRLSIFSSGPP